MSQFSHSVMSDSLRLDGLQQARLPYPINNSRSLLKLMSIVLVMPSNHLILSSPSPTFNLSQHQGLSNELVLGIRWPKYWNFSFSISPSNEYSGLISFRKDCGSPCSPRNSQESSPTSQFKSISYSLLSFLYSSTLTSMHDDWKKCHFD